LFCRANTTYFLYIPAADFDEGTLIIDRPGAYKLCEDITFKPMVKSIESSDDPLEAFQPDFSTGKYDPRAYGLGFFAAISVATSEVQLYLNGHTLQQSREHQIAQRFYANIELASAPFIATTGPHEFVGTDEDTNPPPSELKSARDFYLFGPGVIGRSSHHGIHGNGNQKIQISGVTFQDFEVAAVSLNEVDGLEISDCIVIRNSRDVPLNGMFSAAHFITPYAKYLAENYPNRQISFGWGRTRTSVELYEALVQAKKEAYQTVIQRTGDAVDPLFRNQLGVIDGPWYVLLLAVYLAVL